MLCPETNFECHQGCTHKWGCVEQADEVLFKPGIMPKETTSANEVVNVTGLGSALLSWIDKHKEFCEGETESSKHH